jgi:hypothetical protein
MNTILVILVFALVGVVIIGFFAARYIKTNLTTPATPATPATPKSLFQEIFGFKVNKGTLTIGGILVVILGFVLLVFLIRIFAYNSIEKETIEQQKIQDRAETISLLKPPGCEYSSYVEITSGETEKIYPQGKVYIENCSLPSGVYQGTSPSNVGYDLEVLHDSGGNYVQYTNTTAETKYVFYLITKK